ncbi:zinc-dependent alcohol dehydrogenase family protein [bacterium]|nr:zinc-dependent alcohol dehydrogenase family protein [candidate division CSSED10-310 bacterium]
MKAMVLDKVIQISENSKPLRLMNLPDPVPKPDEILIKVSTCGVCHTELDEIEGRTPPTHFPMVLGHQVVGKVEDAGSNAKQFHIGDRVGVAWIYSACESCELCLAGKENLCSQFKATGRDAFGGYAELMVVPEGFAQSIPSVFTNEEAAPLLCAGAIGYRSLRLTGINNGQRLGLTGFGASAHLVLKLVRYLYPDTDVYVFARNPNERDFARDLGAVWTGDTVDRAPRDLHAIIDTTPVWKPVVEAMANLIPGGRLVINAIRKETSDQEILSKLRYEDHLWMEKEIKSVANVTRTDVREFLDLASRIPIKPDVQTYRLDQANTALLELKSQKIRGGKVLAIS